MRARRWDVDCGYQKDLNKKIKKGDVKEE